MKYSLAIKNLILIFWFGWFALAGIIAIDFIVWITPIRLSVFRILAADTLIGIVIAGLSPIILKTMWHCRNKLPFEAGYIFSEMIWKVLRRVK